MRELDFFQKAYKTYQHLKERDAAFAGELKRFILDIVEHPDIGLGDPVALGGEFDGLWQRTIAQDAFILYTYDDTKVLICAILHDKCDYGSGADFKLEKFSDEDYKSVIALMSANRGKADEPMVGIFWYNRAKNELFWVVSHRLSDYTQANASDGRITCSEMHEDVWKKEFRKQKYHGDGTGPYIGAYQDKPRGRVFYNMATDTFEIAVGKWLEDFPQAYDLILEEFNLPKEKTKTMYAVHWDIGMSWR